jgi:hypothetical protein
MVPAAVVEKELARKAFEEEVREKKAGNSVCFPNFSQVRPLSNKSKEAISSEQEFILSRKKEHEE